MSLTIELLRSLSSPSENISIPLSQDKLVELSKVANKNRMFFFFLYKIGFEKLERIRSAYKEEQASYTKTNTAIARVSQILMNANIKHAFFKTIRPYISTTVDLDIIIFGGSQDHIDSVEIMKNAGYQLIINGPRSTTLLDEETKIGIDIYSEIAVSFITYMDKTALYSHVTTAKLPNGEYVKILDPEADLLCIIAHSIIKEQMYTLSEYYTFINHLKNMDIDNFVRLIRQTNLTVPARTHASITALLHQTAHGIIPIKLKQMLDALGSNNFENRRLIQNNFETPHKYHPITVSRSLLEIAKGKKSRNSFATQIYQMLNPNFSRKFLKAFMEHITRRTY
jgi:hypothetical protein